MQVAPAGDEKERVQVNFADSEEGTTGGLSGEPLARGAPPLGCLQLELAMRTFWRRATISSRTACNLGSDGVA